MLGRDYTDWLAETGAPPERYEAVREASAGMGRFWWRSSPQPLVRSAVFAGQAGVVRGNLPPNVVPGMIRLNLNLDGRIRFLQVVPERVIDESEGSDPFDWNILFDAAGLDRADFEPVPPRLLPDRYADEWMAWEGVFAADENVTLRIEAAALRGRPVSWQYFPSFAPIGRFQSPPGELTLASALGLAVLIALLLGVIAGSIFLARRNVRLGRGDRRGAGRLAMFLATTLMIAWVFKSNHVANPAELIILFDALMWAVSVGGLAWALYLAVEPIMRRHDPERLIGWSRLIDGRLDDPLVGRDLLFGCTAGALVAILALLGSVADVGGFSRPLPPPSELSLQFLSGPGAFISGELGAFPVLAGASLGMLLLYAVALAVLRRRWAAVAALGTLLSGIFAVAPATTSLWAFILLSATAFVNLAVLARFGVLTFAVAGWTGEAFRSYFVTLDFSVWYAPNVLMGMGLFLAVACYGFYRSVDWQGDVTEAILDT